MRRAVIDVGSNSVLLAVAERTLDGWRTIHEDAKVTALGEGTKATGLLGERGMRDTLSAIADFYRAASEAGATEVIAAATMAARIATNATEFIEMAEAQGTPVRVLSGEDEADLGFQAISNDPIFAESQRVSIVDPGGHSTELVTADRAEQGWDFRFRRSFPIGTLGLRSTHFTSEVAAPSQVLSGVAYLDDLFGVCYLPEAAGRVVVLGAAGTNLVSVRDQITVWDPERIHGARLGYEEVSKMFGWLCGMSDAERAQIPGLEPGRERTIHLGALILERALFALRAEECFVSVRGWRHALLEQSAIP
jgi:exopolyphosphatase/guanosine-5'-triphosphate,3'-diphosphate pyrophosphatase